MNNSEQELSTFTVCRLKVLIIQCANIRIFIQGQYTLSVNHNKIDM